MMAKGFPAVVSISMPVASHTSWHRMVRGTRRQRALMRAAQRARTVRYAGYGVAISVLMVLALLEPVSRSV